MILLETYGQVFSASYFFLEVEVQPEPGGTVHDILRQHIENHLHITIVVEMSVEVAFAVPDFSAVSHIRCEILYSSGPFAREREVSSADIQVISRVYRAS